MTLRIADLPAVSVPDRPESGMGTLKTEQGNLPLRGLDVNTRVTGLTATTVIDQHFHNPHSEAIEATYVFPVPERAAVTGMIMRVAGREVVAELHERGEARAAYDKAIGQGKRAAIAEAERADVFTMRVGNIPGGETATVTLELIGSLPVADGQATLRIPLVVAPRFIPGRPLDGGSVGDGYVPDTDEVPDASRITPPVLLPGFPNPIDLAITVHIDPAGLPLLGVASSLHAVVTEEEADQTTVRIQPGERVNRDFILRFDYGDQGVSESLAVAPDADGQEGTFQLTVLPPNNTGDTVRPRDVVILLDRSGSMKGWKMVAARRAAARIVDTLGDGDRFAVRCFDHEITQPAGQDGGLVSGTDRNRFRAVEHLSRADARGGTQMLGPLLAATDLLSDDDTRERVIVLVTDGQVGNEDQILSELDSRLPGIRVHIVGIDRAVNGGFLHRLALAGRGRCELVESEDRLDAATAQIHRRIVAPVITDVAITAVEGTVVSDSLAPSRTTDLFTGVPLVVSGRYRGAAPRLSVTGTDDQGAPWSTEVSPRDAAAATGVRAGWARAHLRDLEDAYAATGRRSDLTSLEQRIIEVSLRHHVMSRFTAFVAVDSEIVNTEGGEPRKIIQPVEFPDGWEMPPNPAAGMMQLAAAPMAMPAPGGSPTGAPMGFDMQAEAATARPRGATRGFGRPAVQRAVRTAHMSGAALRQTLLHELRGLQELVAGSLSEQEQRMELSDLATRLNLLVSRVAPEQTTLAERLRELITGLEACDGPRPPTGASLADLWRRTEAVLSELVAAAEASAGSSSFGGGARPPQSRRRKPGNGDSKRAGFWKRPGDTV